MKDENIMVIRRELLEQLGIFQGFNSNVQHYLPTMLARENNFFTPRAPAETNPSLKQIIPYAILTHAGRILHYVRGKKSGEQRLLSKGSIGIGGHMNDGDEGLFAMDQDAYLEAVRREINEELRISTKFTNRIVGLINDDETEVGRVHLGVVHVFELETDAVTKGESAITELQFLTREELSARRESLETWSQICLDQLDALLAPPNA